jgi:hypothetical protein
MLTQKLRAFFNPEWYQGWTKKRSYFEGWYFKLVNASGSRAMALIPGIAMDAKGVQHAFVQVLDGTHKKTVYHKFKAGEFIPASNRFEVAVGKNRFSDQELQVALDQCVGKIRFKQLVPWPKPFYSPGIMGPFAYVPRMECYHGIVSMDHALEGSLELNGEQIDFTGGRGYIEKDWGHSFPSAYIWLQTNHFSEEDISLKASVARVPWMGTAFVGFIAGCWFRGKLIQFTTYNLSKLIYCRADQHQVHLQLQNPSYSLDIEVERGEATALAAPILGLMEGRIEETMYARTKVVLKEKRSGRLLYEGVGMNTGLEVAGDVQTLIK